MDISSGLDLEYDADIEPTSPEPSMYETIYLTAHKSPCRASAFNSNGGVKFLASIVPFFLFIFRSEILRDDTVISLDDNIIHPKSYFQLDCCLSCAN